MPDEVLEIIVVNPNRKVSFSKFSLFSIINNRWIIIDYIDYNQWLIFNVPNQRKKHAHREKETRTGREKTIRP